MDFQSTKTPMSQERMKQRAAEMVATVDALPAEVVVEGKCVMRRAVGYRAIREWLSRQGAR